MFPPAALELIFRYEPLHHPGNLTGGAHGIVIGYGYDLSAVTATQFVHDWNGLLTPWQLARLLAVVGLTGPATAEVAPLLRDIKIAKESAQVVWVLTELTRLEHELAETFPGSEFLPDLARGALVSLLDSRGPNLVGERRQEMREIQEELAKLKIRAGAGWATSCQILAHLIRCMKRLYPFPGGLKTRERRDAEADLLEKAAKATQI